MKSKKLAIFEGKKIRRVYDEKTETWYFSVVDIIFALTESPNPTDYLKKLRKRDLRRLWITRLNAAVREQGLSYSAFISLLKKKNIELDRKILAELAVEKPEVLSKIITEVK